MANRAQRGKSVMEQNDSSAHLAVLPMAGHQYDAWFDGVALFLDFQSDRVLRYTFVSGPLAGLSETPPCTARQIRTDAFEIHLEETGMTLLIQAPDFEKELVRVHVSSPVTLLDERNGTLKQVQSSFPLERL